MIDVLGPEKRRRRTTQEKIAIVQQSFEPGMTVSLVARQHGVAASQLFLWRKQYGNWCYDRHCSVRLVICFDLAIDQIAQSGLSSLKVIYYSAQLFS